MNKEMDIKDIEKIIISAQEVHYDAIRQSLTLDCQMYYDQLFNACEELIAQIKSLQEERDKYREEITKIRDKAQILASHCAVQMDRGGNVGSAYAFEKSQELYELAQSALKEELTWGEKE